MFSNVMYYCIRISLDISKVYVNIIGQDFLDILYNVCHENVVISNCLFL